MGIDRNVQNTVGHEVYGLYQAIFNLTIIFQIVLDFGLQQYNSKTVAQSPETMSTLFPNILAVKGIFALIYIVVTITMGQILGYQSQGFILLCILVAVQIALSFLLFFRSNISGLQWFKTDSIFSIFDRMIAIPVMAILLFSAYFLKKFQIEWYAWVQLFAYSLSAIIAFLVCIRLQKVFWHHLKIKRILVIIKQSLPFALLVFLMYCYARIDTILLEKISLNADIAGKYAAAFRLLDVANNMSGVLVAGLLLPLFGKMIKTGEDFGSIAELTSKFLIPFSITLGIITSLWGFDILKLLYNNIEEKDADILLWLMWCLPFYSFNFIYATLLTANGNIKILIYISLIGLIVNLGLNFSTLKPTNELNAVFAARNAFITMIIITIGNFLASKKLLNVHLTSKIIIKLILFFALLFVTAFVIREFLPMLNIWFAVSMVIIIAMLLFIIIGIIKWKEIMINYKKLLKID